MLMVERLSPVVEFSAGIARCCPVCAGEAGDVLFDNRMAPIADIDFSYGVVACDGCGMIYASHAPDDATMSRYYRDFSKYDHPRSFAEASAADVDRAAVAAAFTQRVLAPGARVLDVGCSIGLYLSALARTGSFEVRGLDPSPLAADTARRLFDITVEVGSAQDFDGYEAFDGIALLAVLEHLRDPSRLLTTLARRMKAGAILIVEVPDVERFGHYPDIGRASEPLGEFSNEHINFFGDGSLRRLAARAGLSWVASEEFPYLVGIRGLIAAFRKDGHAADRDPVDDVARASVMRYISASSAALQDVEARLSTIIDDPIIVYGAGSHSARLLAQGVLGSARIDAVVDRNPHLTGRTIGRHRIDPPTALQALPGRPVVASSFHAMASMADYLRSHHDHRIMTLYPASPASASRPAR